VLARLAGKSRPGGRPYIPFYQGYLFVLPGFIIYLIFVLIPIASTLRYSFYDWTGFSTPHYVGVDNYAALIDDKLFWKALRHNVFFLGFYTILPILLGLFLTSLLTRSKLRGLAIFRTGLFIPQVMTPIAVGIIWRWLFAFDGPINEFFRAVGAPGAARPWLGDFTYARYAVGTVGTWVEYGLCMMLFIAGAQAIDGELYDAAIAFGANGWQQFRYVTLPGLRQQILVAFIVTFIAGLRVFDLVFVLTRSGGPGTETTVVSLLIYQQAFKFHKAGYAASMAVILTTIIVVVSALVLFIQSRGEGQEVSA
jgi:raffinose/stachyose/melibiose transport system permease protein